MEFKLEIQLNKLTDPKTVITCGNGLITPIANLKKVWFKLDRNCNECWEIYSTNSSEANSGYTIRTVSENTKLYEIVNPNILVWVE